MSGKDTLNVLEFHERYVPSFQEVDFLAVRCLDGTDSLWVFRTSKAYRLFASCILDSLDESFPNIYFYRIVASARTERDIAKLSDMLFYRNYPRYFKLYYPRKVEFYRALFKYKLGWINLEQGRLNEALRIALSLEKYEEPRIRYLSRRLRNKIHAKLGQDVDTSCIEVQLENGIHTSVLKCELDFPETLIVQDGCLRAWKSPIVQNDTLGM